jgi:mTERF domain-containing protein
MFASSWRRLLHKIAGGYGTNPLRSIPGGIRLAHSYSSTSVSSVPNSELCPVTVSYLISCGLSPAAAAAAATTKGMYNGRLLDRRLSEQK